MTTVEFLVWNNMVATAKVKQEVWMFIFARRVKDGQIYLNKFLHREFNQHRKN